MSRRIRFKERRPREAGLSLVELMIALAIGVFLIGGVLTVFAKTNDLHRTNESAARLQETARYAMSTIEADLRMSNHWGLHNRADLVGNAPPLDPDDLPAPDPDYDLDVAAPDLSAFADEISACGDLWAIKLAAYIEGTNDGYALDCGPGPDGDWDVVADTDQLTIRRAAAAPMSDAELAASDGRIKVVSSRTQGELFAGTARPTGYTPPLSDVRALVAHGYYVAADSEQAPGAPSLRRKRLDVSGTTPTIVDEEIVPHVEDLQVEIGVDDNGDQSADFFVPVGTALAADDEAVAVRVWLMVRAERPETGFTDDREYAYADRAAFTPGDGFRRLLVSKTISLRNTRR